MTRSTVMPWSANQPTARSRNDTALVLRSSGNTSL
jgi:hypothetical protein